MAQRIDDVEIGRRVREVREALDFPQTHIARTMTMSRGHRWHQTVVGKVESGDRSLRLTEAVELASILRVPLTRLTGEGEAGKIAAREVRARRELQKLHEQLGRTVDEIGGDR